MTDTARVVADIWCEILGLDGIDESSSFLEVGGSSIAAELIAERVSRTLAIPIEGFDLFDYHVFKSFVAHVDRQRFRPSTP